jgi:hypothetical protein
METNNELQQSATSTEVPSTETTATPVTDSSVEGTEQAASQQTETSTTEPVKADKTPVWVQKRIDQLTAEKYAKDRENADLRAQLSANNGTNTESTQQNNVGDVETRAQQIANKREFDRSCDAVFKAGTAEFPDFEANLGNFKMLGGLSDSFLEGVLQLPDSHKILNALGSDPEEASRIMSLPPLAMGVALSKIIDTRPQGKAVSKVPAPIKTIEATSRAIDDPEKMSQKEWEAWRNKTKTVKY